MSRIYGAAYLTLAASHWPNGDASVFPSARGNHPILLKDFFNDREDKPHDVLVTLTLVLRLDAKSPSHRILSVQEPPMPPSEPLFSRGWALQERAVSTHIAHFTRQELVWEYTASLRCDCGGPGIDETSFMGSPKKQMHEGQIKTYQQEISYATIKWEIIVKAYTQRHYTKPEDQAAAFMGTEQRFGNIVGSENVEMIGEFCAGLWSTYLPSSLLWSCSIDSFLDLPGKSRGRMIRDSETPSWSWYSVIGQCKFFNQTSRIRQRGNTMFLGDKFKPTVDFLIDESGNLAYGYLSGRKLAHSDSVYNQ